MSMKKQEPLFMDEIRRHWSRNAVLTDSWFRFSDNGQELAQEELFEGEVSAVVIQVGCYTVRSAERFYKIQDPENPSGLRIPADEKDFELIWKDIEFSKTMNVDAQEKRNWLRGWLRGLGYPESLGGKLFGVREISARHNSSPDGSFSYIFSVARPQPITGCEYVDIIFTAKKNDHIPDEYASLFIGTRIWVGTGSNSGMWYQFEPTGKITRFNPMDMNKAQFT